MKNFSLAIVAIFCTFFVPSGLEAHDNNTIIQEVHIDYARTLHHRGEHGGFFTLAALGGRVDFIGTDPINVTVKIGGQSYTALTDPHGNYSFLVYTAGAGRFEVEAWVNSFDPARKKMSVIKTSKIK